MSKKIKDLISARVVEIKKFASSLSDEGWILFLMRSEYIGTHEELGEGNLTKLFCFHPSLRDEIKKAGFMSMRFQHGHRESFEGYNVLEKFLEKFKKEDSLIFQFDLEDKNEVSSDLFGFWEILSPHGFFDGISHKNPDGSPILDGVEVFREIKTREIADAYYVSENKEVMLTPAL